ncbi:hypothetical protein BDN67DRAFT_220812 [Paxillus ammoniavirescens]|nr:hypothetical protein BDN67DRAFT_220812 [Paxillus ammoniavirescens]
MSAAARSSGIKTIFISPEVFAQGVQIRQAFVAVGHTFLAYDFFLTIDDELQYIWLAPWTIVKATFLANRYLNLIAQTVIVLEEFDIVGHGAEDFCKHFHLASLLLMVFCVESMHIFVIMKAWVLWGCQRKVAIQLAAGYIIYIGTLIGVGTYYSINIQILSTPQAVQTEICISYTMPYVVRLIPSTEPRGF